MSERVILHSDMNCFYASVEMLHHPEFAGMPLAVGGDPEARHGIVLTANYIAKQKGVKPGMALWQAKQICPEIIFVPPRMDLYLRFSKMAREIYSEYTDKIEPYGIDEAWLDVSDSRNLKGSGMTIAREISHRIKYELGVTVSIGISWNKIYAKLGSDYKKPDAITEFNRENYKDRIWQLPASDLLYVGRQTNKKLQKLGIRTIGQLAESDEKLLESHFGKIGNVLWAFANGWDEDPVCKEGYEAPVKSIGNSTTTPRDLENDLDVWIIQIALAESVAARLRKHGFKCKTVEITVRDNRLYSFSRQIHLRQPTNITNEIVTAAFQLFKDNYKWEHPIRSLGIRAADLVLDDIPVQLDLFGNQEKKEKLEKLDRTVDEIRRRFGYFSIQRAAMYALSYLSIYNNQLNVPKMHREMNNLMIIYGLSDMIYRGMTLVKFYAPNGVMLSEILHSCFCSHYNKTDVEVQQELGIGRTSFYKMKKQALGYLGFYFYEIVVPQAKDKRFKPSLGVEEE